MRRRHVALGVLFAMVTALGLTGNVPAGQDDDFRLKGRIESLPAGSGLIGHWIVSGITVQVAAGTRIDEDDGLAAVGAFVEVKGTLQPDGSISARKIEVQDDDEEVEVKFKGTIQSFPPGFIGDWIVGGKTVRVTSRTDIEEQFGPVAVGAFAEVEGAPQPDGSIDADKIEIKSNVLGGDGRHELKGTIENLPATPGFIGDWVVSGRIVHVNSLTRIRQNHGPVAVGARVEVKGSLRPDGSIDAADIEVVSARNAKARFTGLVESMPSGGLVGQWVIAGRTVNVTFSTRIKDNRGTLGIGARVKVKGTEEPDGSVTAKQIKVKG